MDVWGRLVRDFGWGGGGVHVDVVHGGGVGGGGLHLGTCSSSIISYRKVCVLCGVFVFGVFGVFGMGGNVSCMYVS